MTRRTQQLVIAMLVGGAPLTMSAQTNPAPGGGSAAAMNARSRPAWTATLDCVQCVVHISAGGMWVEFGTEPVFRGMGAGGALLNGDVLVSVEHLLITTVAGARRLAQVGDLPLLLTIRRDGHDLDILFAQPIKWTFGTPDSMIARSDAGDSATAHTVMDRETTRGWLGIALSCERCSIDGLDHTSSNKRRLFTTPPVVVAVDPVAAMVSGFRVRDIIRSIDGLAMTSPEGGTRFSTLRAGERVKFIVERFDNGSGFSYEPTGATRLVTLDLLVPKRP